MPIDRPAGIIYLVGDSELDKLDRSSRLQGLQGSEVDRLLGKLVGTLLGARVDEFVDGPPSR